MPPRANCAGSRHNALFQGHPQEKRVVHGVDNLGLPYAAVAAYAIPDGKPPDVIPLLHDDPDPLVAEHGTASVVGISGRLLACEEEAPVLVEEVSDERVFPTEDADLGAVLRGGVLDCDLDLIASDLGFLVVDDRGLAGRDGD